MTKKSMKLYTAELVVKAKPGMDSEAFQDMADDLLEFTTRTFTATALGVVVSFNLDQQIIEVTCSIAAESPSHAQNVARGIHEKITARAKRFEFQRSTTSATEDVCVTA